MKSGTENLKTLFCIRVISRIITMKGTATICIAEVPSGCKYLKMNQHRTGKKY